MEKYKAYHINTGFLIFLLTFMISFISACNTSPGKNPDPPLEEKAKTVQEDTRYTAIFEKIKVIVSRNLAIDSSLIKPQSKLSDLGADELDTVEFIMELEKEFGITVSDEFAKKMRTIDDAVVYIKEHSASR